MVSVPPTVMKFLQAEKEIGNLTKKFNTEILARFYDYIPRLCAYQKILVIPRVILMTFVQFIQSSRLPNVLQFSNSNSKKKKQSQINFTSVVDNETRFYWNEQPFPRLSMLAQIVLNMQIRSKNSSACDQGTFN